MFKDNPFLNKDLDRFFVGFDRVAERMATVADQAQVLAAKYPPYNLKKIDENKYTIELAVAGFAKTDIEVTLEGNKLVIKGAAKDDELPESYIFKGIAGRNFERTFTLADKIEIKDAEIANGMLKVWLENMVKVQDAVKKIAIKSKDE